MSTNALQKSLYALRSTQAICEDVVNRLIKRLQYDVETKLLTRTTLTRSQCLDIVEKVCVYTLDRLKKSTTKKERGPPMLKVTVEPQETWE